MTTKLQPADFVHLHNHTHYSLLDGLTKVPDLVERVKEVGMTAVAVTDHGTMSGTIEFYKVANEAGIKPIIGLEIYIASRRLEDRDPTKDKLRYHLTLLAMNNQGYQNLMRLSSIANIEGMYYKPRVDHQTLEKYGEGLIVLSGCAGGELGKYIQNDDYKGAVEIAKWYQSVFGDRYYLEMQDHGHQDHPTRWEVQAKVNKALVKMSKELNIPLVVSNDGHYLLKEDQDAHEILLAVGTGAFLSDPNRMSFKDLELHVADPKDVIKRWGKEFPEAILNTKKIADRCQVEIKLGDILIPHFPVPDQETEKSYLDKLVFQGLAWRYSGVSRNESQQLTIEEARQKLEPHILERADYELGVVDGMGFNGYYLLVQDFINWGKDQGIIFGPGRGSGAGSILAYAMRITELDPMKYNLLFERFLNPDRISMPDFDIDIQDTRRDEVIAYCTEKYGVDRVANIVTFGKMAARAAIRDVARVLEVPYTEADRLSKMVPPPIQGRNASLKDSIKSDPDLKKEYENNPTAKMVIDYAMRLEGTIRSHGVHAAGVVIAPDDIVKFIPLEMAQKGVIATQYPMGPVEELGLLKMDFLGLSNLTTINNALRIIKKVYGQEIDLDGLALDDKATYELLQRGETTGVFQLESAGMKRYLKALKPSQFDDIIAMVALYRPGPMQFIDSFIKRKLGQEEISYLHPKFEASLAGTYGILVYQEQFMQISKDFAGFTGGQADTLRKAVGKKKIDLMKTIKEDFINGAIQHSQVDRSLPEKFWGQLEEFANYCFNKSHAACYGLIAYWTAYLKAHYPDAFMAALMTSDQKDIDRLAIEIVECQRLGLTVLPPDINEGFLEFAVVPGKQQIRFGMAAVKGVGASAIEEVLRARQEGKFKSIEDFAKRVSTSKFNKKAWDSLIKAGGFDSLGDRSKILFNLEALQSFASKTQKDVSSGQTDLFGQLASADVHSKIDLLDPPTKVADREKLAWERELMGLYISAHPLDNYTEYFNNQVLPIREITSELDGQKIVVGGLVSSLKTIITKAGSKMSFMVLEDKTGEAEVIIFPKTFERLGDQLVQDTILRVEGRVSCRDKDGNEISEIKLVAEDIKIVTEAELQYYQKYGADSKKKTPIDKIKKLKENLKSKKPKHVKAKPVNSIVEEPKVVIETPSFDRLYLKITAVDDQEKLLELKQICGLHPGLSDVIMVVGDDKQSAVKLPFRVEIVEELLVKLKGVLGDKNVVAK